MSIYKNVLLDAANRSIAYRESLAERAVVPASSAVADIKALFEELPGEGTDDDKIIADLDNFGSPATVAMAGPRYFGYVIGGSYPVTVAANWLATAWDQNVGLHEVTPATATLEKISMEWLKTLFRLPESTGAAFVTGATVANFSSLAAARNRVYADIGWNVESDGLIAAPPVTVVISQEAHPTLIKSLGLLGLGRDRVVRVPVDNQGRMIADMLPDISGPTIVCTQAGNVNTGAFDPVGRICDIVRPQGAWVHVDGAFGLWAAASNSRKHLADGLENADSWATDAHKWLNVPYDSGIAFVRDTAALKAAMSVTAEYLPTDSEFRNPSDYTPELSRRARGVDVWAALKSLGRNGVADLIDDCCAHAQRFAEGFTAAGFDVLNDVVLNQVLVSFGDENTNQHIIQGIQREGTCWCGGTIWQGKSAMRISVSNWSTSVDDVDRSLAAMIKVAKQAA